jgi:lipid-binding SYLF domain-containing protein
LSAYQYEQGKEATMWNRRGTRSAVIIVCAAISVVALAGCYGAMGGSAASKREHIRMMTSQALADLYKAKPAVRTRLEKAAGYAVFSNFNLKIFVLGSGQGYGMAVDNATKKETFMKMAEVGGGVGLGGSEFRAVMIFHDQQAFKDFLKNGMEFSGKASAEAQAADQGMAASQEAKVGSAGEEGVQLIQGVEVYQMTKTGLMAQAMVYGTRYWKDSDLN